MRPDFRGAFYFVNTAETTGDGPQLSLKEEKYEDYT